MVCFEIEIAENNLPRDFGVRVIGVGLTFPGDLMKFFVASRGKRTIGVTRAGCTGLICRIHHGDGFSIKNPGTRPG